MKVGGLAVLIGSAFLYRTPAVHLANQAPASLSVHGVIVVMLGCFLAYDGWQYIAFVAGEVRDPKRNIPLSLALGTGAVIVLYLLANVAYFRVLPISEIAATEHVAATVAEHTMGPLGATLIALTIMLSSAGAANGAILTSPRIYFAQARDGLFFQKLGEIHPRFQTPAFSILVQTAIRPRTGTYRVLRTFALVGGGGWFCGGALFGGVRPPPRPPPPRGLIARGGPRGLRCCLLCSRSGLW